MSIARRRLGFGIILCAPITTLMDASLPISLRVLLLRQYPPARKERVYCGVKPGMTMPGTGTYRTWDDPR